MTIRAGVPGATPDQVAGGATGLVPDGADLRVTGGARALHRAARIGYLARGLFYALLASLVARIAMLRGVAADQARQSALDGTGSRAVSGGRQANAEGALSLISQSLVGELLIACAAAGFLLLAAVRLFAAWRDRRPGAVRRLSVAGQGLSYVAVGLLPISYLLGNRRAGSESQQHATTAQLLDIPGGTVLVIAAGVLVLAVCGWQLRGVARQDFTEGLVEDAPAPLARLARLSGSVGIAARAVVFVPLGIFLIVAGVSYDSRRARGLDGVLLLLAGHPWGVAVLCLIALGLLVFALYSLIEARYRDVARGV
ncbi:MAG TPA: DUF1206 domain-containing protein [Jatrophihabitans sp.]|jgi:hypothetical protein|uniref:DUF1206 domain-containing protein n=1 Tax=Jatrophihabitans sp. TaxID=1932789 RepID=UPI002F25B6F3